MIWGAWEKVSVNKKMLCLILLTYLVSFSLFSSWSFTFDSWEGHPRIGSGLIPTGIQVGVIKSGLGLFDERETELYLLGLVGYQERLVWQDPLGGFLRRADPLVYDQLHFDWTVGLNQYFDSRQRHSLFAGYRGSYEYALDSMIVNTNLRSGNVQTRASWFSGGNSIFGPLSGIGTSFGVLYRYSALSTTFTTADGLTASALAWFGPSSLNTHASYMLIEGSFQAAKTLFNLVESKRNLYSIVVSNRSSVSAAFGSVIPLSVQQTASLGSKVRGFGTFQFPTDYSVANQVNLFLNGPETFLSGLFPRLILFFDIGYGFGELYNTSIERNDLIASTGIEMAFTIRSFFDIGYEMAYLLKGTNYEYPSQVVVGKILGKLRF